MTDGANSLSLALAVPAELNPHGVQVRVVGTRDRPAFCLADLCRLFGDTNPENASRRLSPDEKGLYEIQTPGGPQRMVCVNESGLYTFALTSRADNAKPFRRWVCHEVLPSIRKHGCYPPPADLDADPVLTMLAAAAETRRLQMIHERRLTAVETKVRGIEAAQEEAVAVLDRCEPPSVPAPDKAMRARLNEYVRAYCNASGVPYPTAWSKLYKELYYRCHFDSLRRAKNAEKTRLDVIEEAGHLPDLYAIACEVLVHPPATPEHRGS